MEIRVRYRDWRTVGWLSAAWFLAAVLAIPTDGIAAERLLAFTPLAVGEATASSAQEVGETSGDQQPASASPPLGQLGNAADDSVAAEDRPWADYLDAWRAHHRDPADPAPRRRLGLPDREACEIRVGDGQAMALEYRRLAAIPWVNPQQVLTEHFVILADVPAEELAEIALELERFHAVWTQLFFPLWKDRARWDRAVPAATGGRTPVRGGAADARKLRVVVFRDLRQYSAALVGQDPATRRSTGFYLDAAKTTFLRRADGETGGRTGGEPNGGGRSTDQAAIREARATLYHELTHQLLAEATDARAASAPGQSSGFWLAEGIACLMESTDIRNGRATVGGWESSRLQFARHRVLASGDAIGLSELDSWGRNVFLRRTDLARGYAFAAAHAHRIAERPDGDGWRELLARVARLYQIRTSIRLPPIPRPTRGDREAEVAELVDFLRVDDARLTPPGRGDLIQLCLARCDVTPEGLRRIGPQSELRWLDLTGLPVTTEDVLRLLPEPGKLNQLSLEATRVDVSLGDWLARADELEELDLSWTAIDDTVIAGLAEGVPLSTLWLTGSAISDASLERIAAIGPLKRLDVQRTAVTPAGRERFRARRPDVTLDPLELVPSP
ncbi:MAG: hypothetical protein EA381_11060 [Planctomycetaceae bacterium]|nr:MAG: hypothetical protein EA381_11060 [Planctomycetaceae bacterium]